MGKLKITQRHLDAARKAGACRDRLDVFSVGMDVTELRQDDVVWLEANAPSLIAGAESDINLPLWAVARDGYGDGYGYGYGDGYGYGYGDGYGSGSGSGYGYGSGSLLKEFQ